MSGGKHNRKGSSWRKAMWKHVSERDGLHCQECGQKDKIIWRQQGYCSASEFADWPFTLVYNTSNLELDHRQPLSEGGTNDADNLWLLCRDCHKAKTSSERSARLKRMFAEWREGRVA